MNAHREIPPASVAACIVCAAFLAAGCYESTWTWTLNPDGSGKVELAALLPPPLDIFRTTHTLEENPDELARGVARDVLAKSKGIAAWRDVSSTIAGDGRVLFKGTAYFCDLAAADIEGNPFPTSFLKPSLSRRNDGCLLLGLQVGDVPKESSREKDKEPDDKGASIEPTEEEIALAVKKGKVTYQAIKPVAAVLLSTMKMELVVRPPGSIIETSNFRRREDGTLYLFFDGHRALKALDELAEKDVAQWHESAVRISECEQPEQEVLWRLNELVFGEKGPVRAVLASDAEPLFDYQREVAEARNEYGRILEELRPEATAGARREGASGRPFWGLSGGVVVSARTDSGTGQGWTATVSGGEDCIGGEFLFGYIEISHVTYEEDEEHRDIVRVALGGGVLSKWRRSRGGLALSFGDGDIWAIGPRLLYGVGFFGKHAELYLTASVYAWFGERDDEFDVDVEADIRLAAGIRF